MKYTVSKINTCKFEDTAPAKLICYGAQGTVTLIFYSADLVLVRYNIASFDVPEPLEESYKILAGEPPCGNAVYSCTESEADCTITCRENENVLVVTVNKENSNITVERNGIVIHGGELGTKDTVLPRNQFRLLTTDSETSGGTGSFLFPLNKADRFFGLGDKGGYPDRRMRRFSMYNRDSLGYDAQLSDPLYKSIPFYIKHNPVTKSLCGIYFPVSLSNSFNFGSESPYYISAELSGGPMAYYIISGGSYKQIIQRYCSITGRPSLPPLFSFGFFGSSMNYVEPDDAASRMAHYFDQIEENHIPCEGMYVSSGYLKAADGKRYAFIWNKKKFPDYGSFLDCLAKRGYNLCMNIKPGILTTHPWYKELAQKQYFVKNTDGTPCVVFYWGGEASFIDFDNHDAAEWWKSKLKEVFLSHTNCGIWNDNNELELEDPEMDAFKRRALYPVQMSKASYEASLEENSGLRPWITCRSGFAGMQKYTRTWSGDNVSDWKTLKFNQFQGWSLGLCGIPFYGHDLGGFFGDIPSEELLVRSCQSAVFQPRFIIHSWRENGEPTEPWTYPNALPVIRYFIDEHYRFMPYIYNCAVQASKTGVPMERPLFLEFPDDHNVPVNSVHCMFGDSILKILVVEKDAEKTDVYLPEGTAWYDPQHKKMYSGAQTVSLFVPLDSYEYMVKIPSVLPTALHLKSLAYGLFAHTEFKLYPGDKTCSYEYFEDNGRSLLEQKKYNLWKIDLSFNKTQKKGTVQIMQLYCGCTEKAGSREFSFTLPDGFKFEGTGETVQTIQVQSVSEKKAAYTFTGWYS